MEARDLSLVRRLLAAWAGTAILEMRSNGRGWPLLAVGFAQPLLRDLNLSYEQVGRMRR